MWGWPPVPNSAANIARMRRTIRRHIATDKTVRPGNSSAASARLGTRMLIARYAALCG